MPRAFGMTLALAYLYRYLQSLTDDKHSWEL
jgi:hypothetical protein